MNNIRFCKYVYLLDIGECATFGKVVSPEVWCPFVQNE